MFLELEDYFGLLMLMAISLIPFASIYLTLKTLNWNEGKNLFSTSWVLFFVWLFSSFFALLVWAVIAGKSHYFSLNENNFFILLIPSTLVVNIIFMTVILYSFTSGNRERRLILTENDSSEGNYSIEYRKVFQTAVAVSVITLSVVASLGFFLISIDSKMEKPTPQSNSSFEIYDY